MKKKSPPNLEQVGTLNVSEWSDLGARLADVNEDKYRQLLAALKEIVDAQELLREFDWQLFLRGRPGKRYLA